MKLFHDITLHLGDIGDFFAPSQTDLLSEHASYVSGIDRIVGELKGTDPDTPVRASIFLPKEIISPDLNTKLRGAIERYCEMKIRQNEHEIAALFKMGWKSLYTGGMCILFLLLISPMLDHVKAATESHYFPNFLTEFITIGITLLSWISLWQPLEIFLYRWWPFRREIRILERIKKMDITFESISSK